MSDIGLFPPGVLVWLISLAWSCLCALGFMLCLFIAWRRTSRNQNKFARDRFAGYAVGLAVSGAVAGLSMMLIDRSGSLGAFARWIDRPIVGALWTAMIALSAPVFAFGWNRLRRVSPARQS